MNFGIYPFGIICICSLNAMDKCAIHFARKLNGGNRKLHKNFCFCCHRRKRNRNKQGFYGAYSRANVGRLFPLTYYTILGFNSH